MVLDCHGYVAGWNGDGDLSTLLEMSILTDIYGVDYGAGLGDSSSLTLAMAG